MSEQDAAPSSTEPGILTEIVDEFKALGEKVDHLIHPNAPAVDVAANSASEPSPSAPAAVSTGGVMDSSQPSQGESAGGLTGTEDPNAAATPAVEPSASDTSSSAPPVSPYAVTPALSASVGSMIRERLAAIKAHLIGFEEASRQKIHADLEAIERML